MIGFVGAGNMGGAMIQGMIAGGVPVSEIVAYDKNPQAMQRMASWGVQLADSAGAVSEMADTVVLAVKPPFCADVLEALRAGGVTKSLLSIAVGWTQDMLTRALPGAGIARAMPNTPVQVGQGVIVLNENHSMDEATFARLLGVLGTCARTMLVPESLFDAVTAISGSGPAYVYLFIEALADAGVRQGLTRGDAYALSAQTLLGAASMVLKTKEHPGALKDAVASPGGTTIEAIYALEKAGLRAAVMDAVDACARRARQMTMTEE